MASGLVSVAERNEEGGPFLDTENDENVAHIQPCVGIVLGDAPVEEPGTLYVTTRRLVWLSDEDVQKGYAVDFYSLTMHAISRDAEAYPQPCIYTQIENGNENGDDSEDDAEEPVEGENDRTVSDLSHVTEMRLVPRDSSNKNARATEVVANVIGANHAGNHVNIAELLHHDPRFEDAEED